MYLGQSDSSARLFGRQRDGEMLHQAGRRSVCSAPGPWAQTAQLSFAGERWSGILYPAIACCSAVRGMLSVTAPKCRMDFQGPRRRTVVISGCRPGLLASPHRPGPCVKRHWRVAGTSRRSPALSGSGRPAGRNASSNRNGPALLSGRSAQLVASLAPSGEMISLLDCHPGAFFSTETARDQGSLDGWSGNRPAAPRRTRHFRRRNREAVVPRGLLLS